MVSLLPSGDTDPAPGTVARYLLPYEKHVISVHEHPIVLLWRALAVLAGLAVAGWLSSAITRESTTTLLIIWILWGVLLVWLLIKIADWWVHYFVVTSKRIVLTTGVLLRRVNAIPLDKITDIEFRQSQIGRLLRYGTFEVWSPNQDPRMRTFGYLPFPNQLYLEVSGLIFKE